LMQYCSQVSEIKINLYIKPLLLFTVRFILIYNIIIPIYGHTCFSKCEIRRRFICVLGETYRYTWNYICYLLANSTTGFSFCAAVEKLMTVAA
jgi:hypothetical protein